MKLVNFGSKVIGTERAKEVETFRAERRHRFGPLVLGDKPPLPGTTTPDPAARELKAGLALSIQRIREILADNPYLVTQLLEKELWRPRGARVEALKLFLDHIPAGWVQGKSLRAKIEVLLRDAKADSGVVFTDEARRAQERTDAAMKKKGYVQAEDGTWAKPADAVAVEEPEPEEEE